MFVRVLNRVFLPFNLSIKIKSARGTRLPAPSLQVRWEKVYKNCWYIKYVMIHLWAIKRNRTSHRASFGSGERDTKQFQRVHLITQSRQWVLGMPNCLRLRLKTTKRSVRFNKVSSARIVLTSAADGVSGNRKEKAFNLHYASNHYFLVRLAWKLRSQFIIFRVSKTWPIK